MYSVTREFSFCYGHRLLDYEGKCKHLHGHNGRVRVTVSMNDLNQQGMVHDFSELKREVGGWLDTNWDHRTLLRRSDPLVPVLTEMGEPLFLTEENPTAEYLAHFLFEEVKKMGFPVCRVDFWETPKCLATYTGD